MDIGVNVLLVLQTRRALAATVTFIRILTIKITGKGNSHGQIGAPFWAKEELGMSYMVFSYSFN
jgi:hypothetical protein